MEVLPVKDELAREFYITMAASQQWSIRRLREQMEAMLYERTIISRRGDDFIKAELAKLRNDEQLSPELVFKDPYFLDFTGLKGYYSEHDLEEMLITGMQQFIMELGNGFTFVDRQKRMIIDGEDFYLDLLFYHRKLHRLIAIELKRTRFKAAYKGQMELYLRWLDKNERQEGEESPLGLLLCTEGGDEQIELLQLAQSESVGDKHDQYGFVTKLCLLPVGALVAGKSDPVCNGIQHYHHFVVLKCFYLALAWLRYPDRIKSVSDILIYDAITVKLLEKH